ncbi:MAG: CBS domain-containing protein [Bacteroidia bacterium]|nr:CBS domain-containing protein [Bacteroidia bacterium]
MGELKVNQNLTDRKKATFIQHLLSDIQALEFMLENNLIESGITRIGAEQEFCLVDSNWRPARNSEAILEAINDPHFTTELARYNLEINLDPLELKRGCFTQIEADLKSLLKKATAVAEQHGSKIVLTGILPSIGRSHLHMDYITPLPRYLALNKVLMELRKNNFHLHLVGVDELTLTHDSVLFEACNTSFQMHLQIEPDDFISSHNWSQAIAGPILGICANSPLILGRELWQESRIALFRQSIDTRNVSLALKDIQPRVSFGSNWSRGNAADIFKDNVAHYKVILSKEIEANSMEELKNGRVPKLHALNLHNGTIYPWNRACYGVGNGKPHLRIENRYIPSGPSVKDEIANFALWTGVMNGRPKKFNSMETMMDFRDAKANFIKAARYGKEAILVWDGKTYPVDQLIREVFIPMAYSGLKDAGVSVREAEYYLGIIERRTRGKTGAQWLVSNLRSLKETQSHSDALRMLVKRMHKEQKADLPVRDWPDVNKNSRLESPSHQVQEIMTTRVFTVKENDLANLATNIMQWKNIHHVPVENENGDLSGLLTWSHAKKFMLEDTDFDTLVKDIMVDKIITVSVDTSIEEAIKIMKANEIGCLPIVQKKELVGIITIKDLIPFDHD